MRARRVLRVAQRFWTDAATVFLNTAVLLVAVNLASLISVPSP